MTIDDFPKASPSLEGLQRQIFELQIEQIRKDIDAKFQTQGKINDDHEKRLRLVEDTATKFNFLVYLTMGGGLIGVANLILIILGK